MHIQLAGNAYYFGKLYEKPTIGDTSREIEWGDISEAIPAFFASVFMAFSYSISYGIAGGFIMYCIVKTCKGKAKEVHPIIWTVAALFILDFVCMAIL